MTAGRRRSVAPFGRCRFATGGSGRQPWQVVRPAGGVAVARRLIREPVVSQAYPRPAPDRHEGDLHGGRQRRLDVIEPPRVNQPPARLHHQERTAGGVAAGHVERIAAARPQVDPRLYAQPALQQRGVGKEPENRNT